ncbi:hypothetical protein T492DRAFT_923901 [Pavlovales sp. CCMP2436]|nr:hypothetical protein T492DRAFT_923901 [Pavlovales sp. CCMP2436]
MRKSSLFRLCVFPADLKVCSDFPDLCCMTSALKTLCKKPRAASLIFKPCSPPSSAPPALLPAPFQSPALLQSARSPPSSSSPPASSTGPFQSAPGLPHSSPSFAPMHAAPPSDFNMLNPNEASAETVALSARLEAQHAQITSLSTVNASLLNELARLRAQLDPGATAEAAHAGSDSSGHASSHRRKRSATG